MAKIKITLNRPAKTQFFDSVAGDVTGIRINIINDQVFIRPTTDLEIEADPNNVVECQDRDRGGVQAFLEGSRVKDLLSALYNPSGLPYFTLQRVDNGWIQCVPFIGKGTSKSPDRFVPHLRIWDMPVSSDEKKNSTISDEASGNRAFAVAASPDIERTRDQLRFLRTMLEAADLPGYTEAQMNQLVAKAASFISTVPPILTTAEKAAAAAEADWEQAAPRKTAKAATQPAPKPTPAPEPVAAEPVAATETKTKTSRRAKPLPEPEVRAAMMRPLSPVSPEAAPPRKGKVDLQPVASAPARTARKGFDVNPKPQAQPVAARGGAGSRRRQLVFGMN